MPIQNHSMLTLDDFFILYQGFADAVAAQLPLPCTVDMYALTPEGAMTPLSEHLHGVRAKVPNDILAITKPWQVNDQLIFPFPLSSQEMATAVVSDVDPTFLRKMSPSWLREVREALVERFDLLRLGCVDVETGLYNRRALQMLLHGASARQGSYFFLINTAFVRKTTSGMLQKWRETADLLTALARGQYFSFGFGVFGLYLSHQTRHGALKIARNLQIQLRREGMSKVQIGISRIDPMAEATDEEMMQRFQRALDVAEQRGPFGLCDIDAVEARHPYPMFSVPETLHRQCQRLWRRQQCFTLALISFHTAPETLEGWPHLIADTVARCKGTVIAALPEVLLIFPEKAPEAVVDSVEAVINDARKRFGDESFVAGVATWPLLDCTKLEVLANCRKAQRHASFLGAGSVVFFDHLSLNISGDAFFDEGDYRAALREYRRGLRLKSNDVNLINSLGVALVECNQLRAAAKCFQDALALEPENYMALVNLGRVRQSLGQQAGALHCFERAYAAYAEDRAAGQELFLPLGGLLLSAGKSQQAIDVLCRYLEHSGHDHEYLPFRLLGLAYLEQGQAEQAIQACQQALRLLPHDSIALSVLGLLYVEQGEGSELGLSLCDKALALDNFNPDHWHRLARAQLHLGNDAGALVACQQCLRLQRSHVAGLVQRAMIHRRRGQIRQARRVLQKALIMKGCTPVVVEHINRQLATL